MHRPGPPCRRGKPLSTTWPVLIRAAGISGADVPRIATLDSARVAADGQNSGSVSAGKRADFVLLAGNPLQDTSAVRRPPAVFKGERWHDPAQLYEAVGIRPFTRYPRAGGKT